MADSFGLRSLPWFIAVGLNQRQRSRPRQRGFVILMLFIAVGLNQRQGEAKGKRICYFNAVSLPSVQTNGNEEGKRKKQREAKEENMEGRLNVLC